MIHIYTGNGKGKTTAAFGLAMRAAGRGLKVAAVQFMKGGEPSGEVIAAERCGLFIVERYGLDKLYIYGQDEVQNKGEARKALERLKELISDPSNDLIVGDEAIVAVQMGLITEKELNSAISGVRKEVELILTGRGASKSLLSIADLVTEMVEIKHYFSRGVPARPGIEY